MTSSRPMHMEVDVSVPEPLLPAPPDEGSLGDDERTETRCPPDEAPGVPGRGALPARSPPRREIRQISGATRRRDTRAQSISSGGGDANGRKKKHRRGKHKGGHRHRHHHHWKPYTKMTWDEKKELEERETRRACKRREERFASGQPMAPYNTTQFLMEQHQHSDVNLEDSGHPRPRFNKSDTAPPEAGGGGSGGASASGSSDGEYYSSPDDEEIFLEKEFTEAYENYHAERLQTMSKDELVREYLELESKVDSMEKRRRAEEGSKSTNNTRLSSSAVSDHNNSTTVDSPLQEEETSPKVVKLTVSSPKRVATEDEETVSNLQQEIKRLRQDNEKLRRENEQLRRTEMSNSVNEGEP